MDKERKAELHWEEYISKRFGVDRETTLSLVSSGFEHLLPLLSPENQNKLLTALKRGDEQKIGILEERYRAEFPLVEDGIWAVQGVYSVNENRLTKLGERLLALMTAHPGCSIVAIRDIAREVDGKPAGKSRKPKLRSYFPLMADGLPPAPELDAYILPGSEQMTLKQTAEELKKGAYHSRNRVGVVVRAGNRRPYHNYISVYQVAQQAVFGLAHIEAERVKRREEERKPFAHLCFPRDRSGNENPDFNLLVSIMAEDDCPPVVLMPKYDGQGKPVGIIGRQLNFFPNSGNHADLALVEGKTYRPKIYYFPEVVFPENNWPEALDGLMRLIKTAVWTDSFPIINGSGFTGRLRGPNDILDKERIISLGRQTQVWLRDNIVYFLSNNPHLLSGEKQRTANSRFLLDKFFDALDGNPQMTYLFCQAAGFFDENGFFPDLGRFLQERNRDTRLQSFLSQERAEGEGGRQKFLDFLIKETKGDIGLTAFLLRPGIYAKKEIDTFIRDCIFWHDERFREFMRRNWE